MREVCSREVLALPPGANQEAIVNGIVHRGWQTDTPATTEQIADSLVVTSLGGLIGGVDADNIVTHPSAPRYRLVATLMERIHLAEREWVGVDWMMCDMLSPGQEAGRHRRDARTCRKDSTHRRGPE